MLLATAATYFDTLADTVHLPSPFGSQITPTRGLNALSSATTLPALSAPWFLS